MSTYAAIRVLVLLLVLMPLASAAFVPAFGRKARRVALWISLVHLGLTAAVVTMANSNRPCDIVGAAQCCPSCLRRSRSSRRLLPPVNCGLFSGRFGTDAFLPELVERCLEKKVLEIAPIGFMRGRTLNGLLAGG